MKNRTLRLAFSLSFALASLAGHAQDTGRKVSFQAPAGTAKNVLSALSKAAGVSLAVSPQTEGEILQVDVKDVTLEELMKRIAKVAAAEWKPEGEGFRLVRSQAMQNQQEKEYFDGRAARIKLHQDKLADDIAKLQPLTPALAKQAAEQQKLANDELANAVREGRPFQPPSLSPSVANANPANRLMLKLIAAINPVDLARIGAGTRVVFSTIPTRMQRSLPSAGNKAVSDFYREYQIWLDSQPAQNPSDPGSLQIISVGAPANQVKGGFGKLLLVVSRPVFSNELQAELMAGDGEGNIYARQFRQIPAGPSPGGLRSSGSPPAAPQPTLPPNPNEKPIELSQSAKDHAAYMAQSPLRGAPDIFVTGTPAAPGGGGAVRQTVSVQSTGFVGAPFQAGPPAPRIALTPEWQKKLVEPDKADPLAYVVSELFAGWAQQKGVNLVASFPDSAMIPLSNRSLQIITPTHLEGIAKDSLDLNIEDESGWMTVMPKFPAFARSIRIDRDDLARLLLGIQKEGRLSLDNLSRYANSRANPAPVPALDARYVSALFPFASGDFSQANNNWRTLQLYAVLSVDQRRNLGDGGSLSLGGLSPSQSAIVGSMVYDDLMGPILMSDDRTPGAPGQVRSSARFLTDSGAMMSFGGSNGKIQQERTEFLPTGVPTNGILTVKVTNQDAVFATKKDGSANPRFFTAETYGVYSGMLPNMVLAGTNAPAIPSYDTFRAAGVQTLDFHFQLLERASIDKQLRDTWFQPGARDVAYEGLSNEFRLKAEEAAKRMKDSRANIAFGSGPSGRPPKP